MGLLAVGHTEGKGLRVKQIACCHSTGCSVSQEIEAVLAAGAPHDIAGSEDLLEA